MRGGITYAPRTAAIRTSRLAAWLAVAASLLPAAANAQEASLDPGRSGTGIVVVPTLPDARPAPWVEAVVRQLAPLGASPENALARFESSHSSAPAEVSNADVDRWIARSREAVRHLAQTDYARARDALLEAQSLSERAAEALNREAELQRQVLDTCLFMVRAFLETRATESAEAQARECRRLVPRGTIARLHTPEVRELMRRVDRHLMEAEPGFLRVEADRAGCVVRLNGIDFGRTPFEMHDLARGEYRIQVECDPAVRGRVHRVQLEAVGTHLSVDTRFDTLVRTDPLLHLAYADPGAESASRFEDAVTVGRAVQAREVWIVTPAFDGPDAVAPAFLRADRVVLGSSPSSAATVLLPAPSPAERPFHEPLIQAAQAAFAAGRSVDLRAEEPRPIDPSRARAHGDPPDQEPNDGALPPIERRARTRRSLGIGFASLGGALFATSAGLYVRRASLGDRFEREDPQTFRVDVQQDWLNARIPLAATAATASAALAAGLGLALERVPRDRPVPWWGWAVGGAGVAAIGGGLLDFFLADACGRGMLATPVCVPGAERRDRGLLVMLGGFSLSTVPLSVWLGDRLGGARVEVEVGPGHAGIEIGRPF